MNTEQRLARQPKPHFQRLATSRSGANASAAGAVELRKGPQAPWAIRLFDVVVAAALVCLLAVPMLAIVLVIRLTSRGGALYRQERAGMGGRPFVLYKFRTMRADAETAGQPVWAKLRDPRRTAAGMLLRRFGLDELPQLFNVLKGDMSLVGPRPERPYFVAQFARTIAAYNQRHQVPPGITGWAQINGWRGDSSIEKRLEYDLFYIHHRSVWFNLRILLLTPIKVLFAPNVS